MIDEIERDRQEQERKRQLWREQQQARLKNNLPEKGDMAGGQDKTEVESSREELDEEKNQVPQDRSPRAIAARMRESQRREVATQIGKKLKGQIQGDIGIDSTAQRLKNIYRIINGTSAITVIGVIIILFTMNLQLLVGNLLDSKFIPKLSLLEIIIIIFIDLLFLFTTLILFIFIYAILNPCEIAKSMSQWGAVADLMGATCGLVGKVLGFFRSLF